MDDRTRTPSGTEAPLVSHHTSFGTAGLVLSAMLALLLAALVFTGLKIAIGSVGAVLLTVLVFALIVVFLVPTENAPNEHARRLLNSEGSGASEHSRNSTRRACAALFVFATASCFAVGAPGCDKGNALAYQALSDNNALLSPLTLRGIDDAVAAGPNDGGISPALGNQYRALTEENGELIRALLESVDGPSEVVPAHTPR